MSVRSSILPVLATALGACVSYTEDPADPARAAAEVAARAGGRFDVDAALRQAFACNPELRVREAEARAAGAETTVPLTLSGEVRGRNDAVGLMVDPVALLGPPVGLGPRAAAFDSADARLVEAVAQLATDRWRTVAAVVECFAVDAALAGFEIPDLGLDASAFAAAGLASELARVDLEAAQARARSEAVELDRARRDNLAELRRLLGLDRVAELDLVPLDESWPIQPPGRPGALLDRPDLRLATARFEVADARFHEAVAAQYPSFEIGPNVSLRGDPLDAMATLRIPLFMDGPALGARARREAAREQLLGAFLDAQREATLADQRLDAAEAAAAATDAALRASVRALTAARIGLEVEPDAFEPFARAAQRVLADFAQHRRAAVERARAAVRRAQAWGWPAPPEIEASATRIAHRAGGRR